VFDEATCRAVFYDLKLNKQHFASLCKQTSGSVIEIYAPLTTGLITTSNYEVFISTSERETEAVIDGFEYPAIALAVATETQITLADTATDGFIKKHFTLPVRTIGVHEITAVVRPLTHSAAFPNNSLRVTLGGDWALYDDATAGKITIQIPVGDGRFL
jgi:hypothetical protein